MALYSLVTKSLISVLGDSAKFIKTGTTTKGVKWSKVFDENKNLLGWTSEYRGESKTVRYCNDPEASIWGEKVVTQINGTHKDVTINVDPSEILDRKIKNAIDRKIEDPFDRKIEDPFDRKIEDPFDKKIEDKFDRNFSNNSYGNNGEELLVPRVETPRSNGLVDNFSNSNSYDIFDNSSIFDPSNFNNSDNGFGSDLLDSPLFDDFGSMF